jgi:hypothetical protein
MLKFPPDCDTPSKRTEYCYRAQELLRRLHNSIGKWYREGLAQSQWERFPQKIKNKYPYKPQLSQDDWDEFLENIFEPISTRISQGILDSRQLLFESTAWEINVEDI